MIRLLALLCALSLAPPAERAPLRIEVTGLDGDRGTARIAVFDSQDTFLREAAFATIAPIADGRSVWTLSVPPGTYAVAVHHDEDGDGEMKRGLFGIPTEPAGFSNGARARFGPPKWRDAAVTVPESGATIHVRVR